MTFLVTIPDSEVESERPLDIAAEIREAVQVLQFEDVTVKPWQSHDEQQQSDTFTGDIPL